MKRSIIIGTLFSVLSATAQEQDNPLYVAARPGLNMRETADVSAKVLDKIPYGTKVVLHPMEENSKKISTEGLTGYWRKVTYNSKTGYIIDSYLFPFVPPKTDVKTMKDYLAQLSAPFGSLLTIKSGDEETETVIAKQLYKNGAEHHDFQGYEFSSNTFFLPKFTMQQGFLLVRMIAEFKEVMSEKDEFPLKDKTYKKGEHEYTVKVDKEVFGDTPWVKRISIEFESGIMYSFEMYQIDNQLVIYFGGGV